MRPREGRLQGPGKVDFSLLKPTPTRIASAVSARADFAVRTAVAGDALMLSLCCCSPKSKLVALHAPLQYVPLPLNETTGRWKIISHSPYVSTTTGIIDWEKWEAQHQPPLVYDRPQLKMDYYGSCAFWPHQCCSMMNSRSWCCRPCIPACLTCCCICGTKFVDLREPDDFFATMLHEEHPNTPDVLRGVFWMHDNVTAPEEIMTLSDADWHTPFSGLKAQQYNWTRDCTLFGLIFYCIPHMAPDNPNLGNVRLELSPSGKWIWMQGDKLIYIVQPHDVIRDVVGRPLHWPAGTLMRISYADADPNKGIDYQYHLTRVAFKCSDGAIVKMAGYEELQQQMRFEPVYRCSCCGVGLCLNDDEFMTAIKSLSPSQMYMPKP